MDVLLPFAGRPTSFAPSRHFLSPFSATPAPTFSSTTAQMASRSALSWAAPGVENVRCRALPQISALTAASTVRVTRRNGAGARTRNRKAKVVLRWESRGSSSAVGLRSLPLVPDEDSVAQGLLAEKVSISASFGTLHDGSCSGGVTASGRLHGMVQGSTYIWRYGFSATRTLETSVSVMICSLRSRRRAYHEAVSSKRPPASEASAELSPTFLEVRSATDATVRVPMLPPC